MIPGNCPSFGQPQLPTHHLVGNTLELNGVHGRRRKTSVSEVAAVVGWEATNKKRAAVDPSSHLRAREPSVQRYQDRGAKSNTPMARQDSRPISRGSRRPPILWTDPM